MSMTSASRASVRLTFLLVAVGIVLLGWWLRCAALMRLPVFIDEAVHLDRAHAVNEGLTFAGNIRKWLYPVVVALFAPSGPEGPWLARALSALVSTITLASCITLGNHLGRRPSTGLLAGLIYAVLPLAVFHERQALADPLLAAFTTTSTALIVRLARRPRLLPAALLGALLAGAQLTKLAALPYLALPPVGVLLLARRPGRWRAILASLLSLMVALVIVAGVYRLAAQAEHPATDDQPASAEPAGSFLSTGYWFLRGNVVRLTPQGQPAEIAARLGSELPPYFDVLSHYVGWAALALVALSGVWALAGERRRSIAFLAIPALGFALVPLLAERPSGFLAARYLLATAAPLATLVALSLRIAVARWKLAAHPIRRWGVVVLLGALFGPGLAFAAALMGDPAQAPLVVTDQQQYTEGGPSGKGTDEVVAALAGVWHDSGGQRLYVIADGQRLRLRAELGPRAVAVQRFKPWSAAQRDELAGWLAQGSPTFFLSVHEDDPLPAAPHGARLELVGRYERGVGELALYRVTGASGALADAVAAHRTAGPEYLAADYAALAAALSQDQTPRPALVFPASHATALEGTGWQRAIPLPASAWPLSGEAASSTLDDLGLGDDGSPVEVILADEGHTDPGRVWLLALQDRLYPVDDSWFGLLHRLRYVTGPAHPPLTPLSVEFEGPIQLAEAALLDPQGRPGQPIRVVLVWQSPVAIRDSLHVFVHLVTADGTLIAQRDGIPGNGLFPMPSWQPGQPVVDRFAILIPPEAPPSEVEIRVGIYAPDSGLRLPVISGIGAGGDYAVIGHLTILPSE